MTPPQQDSELNNWEKNVFYVCINRAGKAYRGLVARAEETDSQEQEIVERRIHGQSCMCMSGWTLCNIVIPSQAAPYKDALQIL